jgi:hypothetical protein
VNVNEYDAPVANGSDENDAGEPVSETIVWEAPSLFTHVTVVPVFTVSAEGSNAKFLIEMVFPPVEAGVPAGAPGGLEEEQPAAIQARIKRTIHAVQNSRREYADIILLKDDKDKKVLLGTNLQQVRPAKSIIPEFSQHERKPGLIWSTQIAIFIIR